MAAADEMIYYVFHVLVQQIKVDDSTFCRIYIVLSWPANSPVSAQIIYGTTYRTLSFTASFSFSRIHADDCCNAALCSSDFPLSLIINFFYCEVVFVWKVLLYRKISDEVVHISDEVVHRGSIVLALCKLQPYC